MPRLRTIKPGFYKNEALLECEPLARILFSGLWCWADREGRLEDRPRRLKIEILPADNCDADALLQQLADAGLILRYQVRGVRYIQVLAFKKHQSPHKLEAGSTIPAPEGFEEDPTPDPAPDEHHTSTVQEPDEHGESTIPAALVLGSGVRVVGSGELAAAASAQGAPAAPAAAAYDESPQDPRLASVGELLNTLAEQYEFPREFEGVEGQIVQALGEATVEDLQAVVDQRLKAGLKPKGCAVFVLIAQDTAKGAGARARRAQAIEAARSQENHRALRDLQQQVAEWRARADDPNAPEDERSMYRKLLAEQRPSNVVEMPA